MVGLWKWIGKVQLTLNMRVNPCHVRDLEIVMDITKGHMISLVKLANPCIGQIVMKDLVKCESLS